MSSINVTNTYRAEIPELTTPRLRLRAFSPNDFEAYAAMMADPDVTRHLGEGRPLTRVEAWRRMAMFAGHWMLRGFGLWAVVEQSNEHRVDTRCRVARCSAGWHGGILWRAVARVSISGMRTDP